MTSTNDDRVRDVLHNVNADGFEALRPIHPPGIRTAIVPDDFSPHPTTGKDARVGDRAAANDVELACTPANSPRPNRIGARFAALRCVAPDGTDHVGCTEQGSMVRRYAIRRNRHADDQRLRAAVDGANVARHGAGDEHRTSGPVMRWCTAGHGEHRNGRDHGVRRMSTGRSRSAPTASVRSAATRVLRTSRGPHGAMTSVQVASYRKTPIRAVNRGS